MINASQLPLPILPQSSDNKTVTVNDISVGDGLFVVIAQYSNAAVADTITVFWDDVSVYEIVIKDVATYFPIVTVIDDNVSVGTYSLHYSARDYVGNESVSATVEVVISDRDIDHDFPVPVFTDAVNDIISAESIEENNGTHLHIDPYSSISVGDSVDIFVTKTNSDDEKNSQYYAVSIDSTNLSGIKILIDKENVAWGGAGYISAYYSVKNADGDVEGNSDSASATVESNSDTTFRMILSTGASNTDYDVINVYPYNRGIIHGTPGKSMTAFTSSGALFSSSALDTLNDRFDENGKIHIKLYSYQQGGDVITVSMDDAPDNQITRSVLFGPYRIGEGKIKSINYSTGAPADGVTPCSIYLKTQADSLITKVRVKIISGSASIDGYNGKTADVLLNSDFSATIDIVDNIKESITVELSLPEASGSENTVSLVFSEK